MKSDHDLGALDILEFAHAFRISRSKVYGEIRAGRLRSVHVGSRQLITRAQARDYQALLEAEAAAAREPEAA